VGAIRSTLNYTRQCYDSSGRSQGESNPSGDVGAFDRRVAIVTHGFLPLVGGSETIHALAADRLARLASVRIFTSTLSLNPQKVAELRPISKFVSIEDASVNTCYLPSILLLHEKVLLPWSLLRELIRFRPDITWTNHPSASSLVAGLLAIIRRTRWVAMYHADLDRDRFARRMFMKLETILLRRASSVEVSTRRYAATLVSRGVKSERVIVVPPFTWRRRLGSGPREREPGPQPSMGKDHPFLFVGVLDDAHKYKRPESLIRAMGELKRMGVTANLSVVGAGNRLEALRLLAAELECSDSIQFLGSVSDVELGQLFRKAWALVVPSSTESEGFGLVILEAISHGCPVIASDKVPSMERFAMGEGARTFHAGDPGSLREALLCLIRDPDSREDLVRQTRDLNLQSENDINLDFMVKTILGPLGSSAFATRPPAPA
jgi:glycosyltransferase involved in cell wall biosynthesis